MDPSVAAATAVVVVNHYFCCRRLLPPLAAMGDTDSSHPPWSVFKVLVTSRLPDNFSGVLSAYFLVNEADRSALVNKQHKGRVIHAFMGRLTAESDTVPGLVGLTLIRVNWNRE